MMTTMLSVAQIFGSTLQRVRRQQGLTQKQLGRMTNTSHTFIGEMERGMKAPNLNLLVVALARMLRISVDELVACSTPAGDAAPRWSLRRNDLHALRFVVGERDHCPYRPHSRNRPYFTSGLHFDAHHFVGVHHG